MFNDIDIVTFMKIRRLSWLGHVNRMSSDRKVKQIFLYHLQGCRPRVRRPKNRWWDYVHQHLVKCKIRDWKQNSLDRNVWRRSIKEVEALIRLKGHLGRRIIIL